ncbi:Zinc finger, CCCH-type [Dillenia turbinata]|uniref:Zinc finger, CCCH-type n=1 Tax=Dillenia turbinata TaxID=194707 RepID=A0AAN8VEL7_9MAGN
MDFGGENVVQPFPEVVGNVGFDNWASGVSDQGAIWATEDDYTAWNAIMPTPETPSRSRSGSEPPNKKNRNTQVSADVQVVANNRSKAIGKMFFKTKLCCKFRAGVCPYVTNCNFAHGIEELRRPPPNWQEIVAAHEEERGVSVEPREEHHIPTLVSSESRGESQRSYKGRHCKKFYTEEGCPYGDNCTFLHDEQSRARESVAISLSPTVGGGGGYASSGNGPYQKPSNWKTRICNKWETTGSCPFGNKCHFAHGIAELHKYGGGLVDADGRDISTAPADLKQGSVLSKSTNEVSVLSSPHPDVYHVGVGGPSQRPTVVAQRVVGQRPIPKWKGPDKISRIYGDWIDDLE